MEFLGGLFLERFANCSNWTVLLINTCLSAKLWNHFTVVVGTQVQITDRKWLGYQSFNGFKKTRSACSWDSWVSRKDVFDPWAVGDLMPVMPTPSDMGKIPWKPVIPKHKYQHLNKEDEGEDILLCHDPVKGHWLYWWRLKLFMSTWMLWWQNRPRRTFSILSNRQGWEILAMQLTRAYYWRGQVTLSGRSIPQTKAAEWRDN